MEVAVVLIFFLLCDSKLACKDVVLGILFLSIM